MYAVFYINQQHKTNVMIIEAANKKEAIRSAKKHSEIAVMGVVSKMR